MFEWFVTYITSIKFAWIVSYSVKLQHYLVRKPPFRINDILVLAHYALIECASSKCNCDSKFCSQNSHLSTFFNVWLFKVLSSQIQLDEASLIGFWFLLQPVQACFESGTAQLRLVIPTNSNSISQTGYQVISFYRQLEPLKLE